VPVPLEGETKSKNRRCPSVLRAGRGTKSERRGEASLAEEKAAASRRTPEQGQESRQVRFQDSGGLPKPEMPSVLKGAGDTKRTMWRYAPRIDDRGPVLRWRRLKPTLLKAKAAGKI